MPPPVDVGVLGDLVHALADADPRCQVDHRVDPHQGLAHAVRVADVALDELDLGLDVARPAGVAVHLREEGVERAHPVSLLEELAGQVGSDEAGNPPLSERSLT